MSCILILLLPWSSIPTPKAQSPLDSKLQHIGSPSSPLANGGVEEADPEPDEGEAPDTGSGDSAQETRMPDTRSSLQPDSESDDQGDTSQETGEVAALDPPSPAEAPAKPPRSPGREGPSEGGFAGRAPHQPRGTWVISCEKSLDFCI